MCKIDSGLKSGDKIMVITDEDTGSSYSNLILGEVLWINRISSIIKIHWRVATYWNITVGVKIKYELDVEYSWIKSIEKIDDTAFEAFINCI